MGREGTVVALRWWKHRYVFSFFNFMDILL